MWKVLLLSALHVVGVMNRPTGGGVLAGHIWPIDVEAFRQRLMSSPSIHDRGYELFAHVPQEKRGFTMLARWAPLNNIGKHRSSIKEHNNRLSNLEIVSADARAPPRQIGQPLRWG